VITLTEEHALARARQADKEIAAGKYRGPLHGIPLRREGPARHERHPHHLGRGVLRDRVPAQDAAVVARWTPPARC
jgi:Asp-tRNA(Asn)/Glu-tRNA(Gln) amidotransferase A subunit family amidase